MVSRFGGHVTQPLGHDARRVAEYVLWLASESGKRLDPMQVLKLVYIAHGWMLGLRDSPLINESAEAWTYGPVVPSVYQKYKKFRSGYVTDVPETEPSGFTEGERTLMRQVWDRYSGFTGLQLSELTHKPGTPWAITRQVVGAGAVIPNDLIQSHYKQLARERRVPA